MVTRLLVSVRNVAEAREALIGGADIIDVKEPNHGSLGAASCVVIEEIGRFVHEFDAATTVSAAMGEIVEADEQPREFSSMRNAPALYKAGLAGVLTAYDEDGWQDSWAAFRGRHKAAIAESQWVTVCYADYQRADAPSPSTVLAEGSTFGSPVLLIDTFEKDGTDLLDWLSVAELQKLREQTDKCGMQLALAGRLSVSRLSEIQQLRPDIVAVRGAACEQGDRTSRVASMRVRELKDQLNNLQPI